MKNPILIICMLLFSFNSSAQSTLAFTDFPINPPGVISNSNPKGLFVFNGKLFFSAAEYQHGSELWCTNGTLMGTFMVKDILANGTTGGSNPYGFTEINGMFIFAATDTIGRELWISDGTTNGTHLLKDIYQGGGHANPADFTKLGSKVIFTARDGSNHTELWVTDGTAGGTQLLKDIRPGSSTSYPSYLTAYNGNVIFVADNGSNGTELWSTDGTANGTQMLVDIVPGPYSSDPVGFTEMGGKLYFYAKTSQHGSELWVTDGTIAGTKMVKDIYPGYKSGMESNSVNPLPVKLAVYNNKLYFSAKDSAKGYELWCSDGTDTGTNMLKDINPGPGSSSSVHQYIVYNSKLYFSAYDDAHGSELWVTDGTTAGTQMVIDFSPGASRSVPSYFVLFNNLIYYRGRQSTTDLSDFQLVQTDGTASGTKILFPNTTQWPRALSATTEFIVYNSGLYFGAVYDNHDFELWALKDTSAVSVQRLADNDFMATIYPNPNNGVFTVECNDETLTGGLLCIYDMLGSQIYKDVAEAGKIRVNISRMPPGVYMLTLQNNNRQYKKRIVLIGQNY